MSSCPLYTGAYHMNFSLNGEKNETVLYKQLFLLYRGDLVNCINYCNIVFASRGHRGCDCLVVGFTTTYTISAYHQ